MVYTPLAPLKGGIVSPCSDVYSPFEGVRGMYCPLEGGQGGVSMNERIAFGNFPNNHRRAGF